MPQETDIRFYKSGTDYLAAPWAGNTPYGHTPISAQEFLSGAQSKLPLTSGANREALEQGIKLASSLAPTAMGGGQSGYQIVGGVPHLTSSLEYGKQQAADIASGKLVNIGGNIFPAGSPAALQAQGQDPRSSTLPQYQEMIKANPVAILSSQGGKDTTQQNLGQLAKAEQYLIQSGDTLSRIAQQKGTTVQNLMTANPQLSDPNRIQAGATLTIPSRLLATSPATQAMVQNIQQAEQEGIKDDAALANIQQQGATVQSTLADAANAKDANDPVALNSAMKAYGEAKSAYEAALTSYNKQVIDLRADRNRLSLPGQREKELSIQANNIKTEIDQINLANEQRKFAEYEGQTAGFARGRGSEFDIRTGFQTMERRLALQNVLGELGIEQGARGMQLKTAEQSLADFRDDYALQQDVNEKLMAQEEKIIDRADRLTAEAKDSLFVLLETLGTVNPETLTPQTKQQLQAWSKTAGIPFDVVSDALKATYQRQVFEDAKKGGTTEKPLSVSQVDTFRRSYGWTPPLGFTQSQLEQYVADNPNATPEELEAGARGVTPNQETQETPQSSPQEVIAFVLGNMNDAQKSALKKRSDVAGISSIFKPAGTDIANYLDSVKEQIQEALDAGYTKEEILVHLAS